MRNEPTWLRCFSRSPVRATLAAAMLCCLPAWLAFAQSPAAATAPTDFAVPAGPLAQSLVAFSTQTNIQLTYQPELVAGKQAAALSGRLTWQEALTRLLSGSGLEYQQISADTIVIRKSQAGSKSGAAAAPAASSATSASDKRPVTEIAGITVTGTRIRGGDTPSSVLTIGAENIREEGFDDLGEVIRSLPQNFTGGQNPGVFSLNLAGGGIQNQNLTGGSTLNLRGLGPDATLTLLNGRRMAYGGFSQAVDISAIPVEAVERVEIVADGASAIYGSDAVGGVGNVILAPDFNGVTLGTRYGGTADGGMLTREYTATAGTTWSSGGLIATYKDASVDPIYARQRDYTAQLTEPTTIYPGSDLHSGLISAHQSFGDDVEVHLDALRTKRDQFYNTFYGGSNIHVAPQTTTTFVSPSVDFNLPADWTLVLAGTWGKDEHLQVQTLQSLQTRLSTPMIHDCYCNKSRSLEAGAEGPLFELAGGDARLAVGAGYRKNEFEQFSYLTNTTVIQGAESSRFAYGEINLPLLGSESDGRQRLAVTAAVRTEDYDSYGRVTTPKLGAIYNPFPDITLKTSWGRSFKMPTLLQLYRGQIVGLVPPAVYGGSGFSTGSAVLTFSGGNPDLAPERARSWTTSLGFHPEAVPGLDMELSWFDIDYADRVIEPIANPSEALSNPIYAPFIRYAPTAEELAAVLSHGPILNYTGAPYDPSKVVAIMYDQFLNASSQHIKGLDLTGSYPIDIGDSRLTIRGTTSWLQSSQRTIDAQRAYALAGTLFNPAKINSRIGAVWSKRGLSLSLFAKYTGGVTNTLDGKKSASFTTIDATLHYATGIRDDVWSETDISLTAWNLLNRSPPLYTPAMPLYVAPYDSTNYSAIGRYLSVSVSKHW